MEWWWSYLLTAIGVTGLWFAGNKSTYGWMIGIGVQVLWVAYALSSAQYGFLLSAVAYGYMNIRNLIKWKKEHENNSDLPRNS